MINTNHNSFLRHGLVAFGAMAAVAIAALPGCSEQPPAKVPMASTAGPASMASRSADQAKPENVGNIHIDKEIAAACNIPIAHFAFDSSDISGQAAGALNKLASCLSEGPLKGRGLKIVGYADPRGTVEYNFALGQRRAGSVAEFLQAHGLGSDHMTTMSMGELEATGSDEAGWALDRKVEIMLAHKSAV